MSNEGVSLSVEHIDDEYIDELIQQAISAHRRHQSGARGQMIMPSDSIEWWIVRATWGAATEQAAAALRELETKCDALMNSANYWKAEKIAGDERIAELEAERNQLEARLAAALHLVPGNTLVGELQALAERYRAALKGEGDE